VEAGVIIHVDDDAPAGGDGTSWPEAYRFLQDALAFAAEPANDVSAVRIGAGTYHADRNEAAPAGTGDREVRFALVTGVAIEGGYAGYGAPDPDARDISIFITALSGDLAGDDESGGTDAENSRHVVDGSFVTEAVLDGVTITGGNADSGSSVNGGGVLIINGDVTLRDCAIDGNKAPTPVSSGGGVFTSGGDVRIERCAISNNVAAPLSSSDTAGGGGLFGFFGSVTITDSMITSNSSKYGGGMYVAGPTSIVRSTLDDNTGFSGAGIYRRQLSTNPNDLTMIGCQIRRNRASGSGGGIDFRSGTSGTRVINCVFLENEAEVGFGGAMNGMCDEMLVLNTLFAGNYAKATGGAIDSTATAPKIINCTLVFNTADFAGGGLHVAGFDPPVLLNVVFWGNEDPGGNDETAQIHRASPGFPWPAIDFSAVQGLTGDLGGSGNIGDDPMFIDPDGPDDDPATFSDNDYRLVPRSPCNESGHNWAVPPDVADFDDDGDISECMPVDLDGNPRFALDEDGKRSGCGEPIIVGMGAYELIGPSVNPVRLGDINGDGVIGFSDLVDVLSRWGPCESACCISDFDMSGDTGFADLLLILSTWG